MAITCPVCTRTSQHPMDELHGYCANCNAFTSADHGIDLSLYGDWVTPAKFVFDPPIKVAGRYLPDGTPLVLTTFDLSEISPLPATLDRDSLLFVMISRTIPGLRFC
jgi:hypothetical protein